MRIIGIDPGLSGGIACIFDDARIVAYPMPETEHDVALVLDEYANDATAFIEAVHSMPNDGGKAAFTFGRHYGFLRGVLVALRVPFEEVPPRTWQATFSLPVVSRQKAPKHLEGDSLEMWQRGEAARVSGLKRDKKNAHKAAAQRLWPSQKWTHATADAALIAEFGRREMARRVV